ncbi:DotU family type IV/VI secretion system protein, partial [Pseudomonas aeruginosa]
MHQPRLRSLLITLHNEAWGGEKVFQLLEHCLQNRTSACTC